MNLLIAFIYKVHSRRIIKLHVRRVIHRLIVHLIKNIEPNMTAWIQESDRSHFLVQTIYRLEVPIAEMAYL